MKGGGDRKVYPLRVDPALWSAVERCAAAELRSVNAQVECLLREALKERGVKLKAVGPEKARAPAQGESRMKVWIAAAGLVVAPLAPAAIDRTVSAFDRGDRALVRWPPFTARCCFRPDGRRRRC